MVALSVYDDFWGGTFQTSWNFLKPPSLSQWNSAGASTDDKRTDRKWTTQWTLPNTHSRLASWAFAFAPWISVLHSFKNGKISISATLRDTNEMNTSRLTWSLSWMQSFYHFVLFFAFETPLSTPLTPTLINDTFIPLYHNYNPPADTTVILICLSRHSLLDNGSFRQDHVLPCRARYFMSPVYGLKALCTFPDK